MFDETTERLMNATPQTVQVERELAHRVRLTISKLLPAIFGEQRKHPALSVTGDNITICQRRSKISPPGRSKTSPLNVMRYAVLGGLSR